MEQSHTPRKKTKTQHTASWTKVRNSRTMLHEIYRKQSLFQKKWLSPETVIKKEPCCKNEGTICNLPRVAMRMSPCVPEKANEVHCILCAHFVSPRQITLLRKARTSCRKKKRKRRRRTEHQHTTAHSGSEKHIQPLWGSEHPPPIGREQTCLFVANFFFLTKQKHLGLFCHIFVCAPRVLHRARFATLHTQYYLACGSRLTPRLSVSPDPRTARRFGRLVNQIRSENTRFF